MKNMIVTGGAGFIGSNFVRLALRDSGFRIVIFDSLTYAGNLDNLDDVLESPRVTFFRGDISDRETVRRAFAEHRPAAVVNFAAESHVDRSIDDASAFIQTNIVGAFELLEGARHFWSGLEGEEREAFRFLHVSTDEVYGSLGKTGLFSETTPYAPNSPYAASKAAADHLVRAFRETHGLPALITNCSNNYGPYQFPEKLIPLMILNAVEGKALPIYGDGANVRDWIFVDDHCRGILRVLANGRLGEKYNIGGSCERTNLEVVDALCEALETLLPAATNTAFEGSEYKALKTFVADRPGHDRRYAIDDRKIRDELGWAPAHDFESGIAVTVRWYLDNREWCEEIHSGNYRRERLGRSRTGESEEASP